MHAVWPALAEGRQFSRSRERAQGHRRAQQGLPVRQTRRCRSGGEVQRSGSGAIGSGDELVDVEATAPSAFIGRLKTVGPHQAQPGERLTQSHLRGRESFMNDEPWDQWHYFPGTAPEGIEGYNPRSGDPVDIECRDKFSTFPDTPRQMASGLEWDPMPPHGINAPHLAILRWRHRQPEAARQWREWQDGLRRRSTSPPSE